MKLYYSKEMRSSVNRIRSVWFIVLLCVTSGLNVGFLYLNLNLWEKELRSPIIYFIVFAFAVITTGVLVFFAWLIYRHYIIKPLYKVCESARKVAAGDFSVRLPLRKGKKIDEFTVLYNDFNIMVEELSSTEMLKNDFITNVSHEIKTPLAVIQNLSTMLLNDGLSEDERKSYAKKISIATKNLSTLTTDILALNRLENQKILVNKKHFNLCEQLYRCSLNFEQIWEEKNIDINIDCDDGIVVFSDEQLLDMVWNNLLSNAFKFTPQNGEVTVKVSLTDNKIIISVSDTGCGIDERDIQHIFDKFYQADSSHKTKGNGLGLALVREILSLTNGEIKVESTLGKGSRFTVTFPVES